MNEDPIKKANKIVKALQEDYPKLKDVPSDKIFDAVMDVIGNHGDQQLQKLGKEYRQVLTAAQVLKRA